MKKIFLLFALMGLVSVATVSAQTCSKATAACCAKSKTTATSMTVSQDALVAADRSSDIEKRTCEKSGTVSFVRKSVCPTSGTVSFVDVAYNVDAKKFVNVSPSDMAEAEGKTVAKKSCCAGAAAACTKKTTTAVKKTSTAKAVKVGGR